MPLHMPLDDTALVSLAEAVFRFGPADVVECDSPPGQPLRVFATAGELLAYAREARRFNLRVAVRYPDMGGRLVHRRVDLCAIEHDHRYTAEGWGLIRLDVPLDPCPVPARVSANSQRRAENWQPTLSMMPPPEDWHWPAVERHLRRLRRMLKAAWADQLRRLAAPTTLTPNDAA